MWLWVVYHQYLTPLPWPFMIKWHQWQSSYSCLIYWGCPPPAYLLVLPLLHHGEAPHCARHQEDQPTFPPPLHPARHITRTSNWSLSRSGPHASSLFLWWSVSLTCVCLSLYCLFVQLHPWRGLAGEWYYSEDRGLGRKTTSGAVSHCLSHTTQPKEVNNHFYNIFVIIFLFSFVSQCV